MVEKRCWDIIVDSMCREGVRHVFGLPGHPAALYDSLYDTDIEPILVRHEASGAFMAMASAKLMRRPSVCFASPGPGVSNLIPGVLEAYSGCVPMIVLGGSVALAHEGEGAFQEAPQMEMLKPITKWGFRLHSADRAAWAVRRGFTLTVNGKPGPVYIEVPFDVGQSMAELGNYRHSLPFTRVRPDPEAVGEAAALLLSRRRPVIVAGGGALYSNASREITSLAELLGIPVITTPSGRGIVPEDHPLSVGQIGLYRTRIGRDIYQDADLLISLGSRNEEFQTAAWSYYPEDAGLIQVDIDPSELGRNWLPDVAVVADVKLFLVDLLDALSSMVVRKPLAEMPRVNGVLKAKEVFLGEVEEECRDPSKPLKTKRIIHEAERVFGQGTVLVNENGSQDLWSYYWPYYRVLGLDGCVAPAEQTCMGFAVAGCIGAKLVAPDRNVICTTGDGAFQMFMKELPTAVQYNAPVTWIVLNNFSLGWIKLHERANDERYIAVDFDAQPDFAAIAEASGCWGVRVTEPERIRPALEMALRRNMEGVPAVLDFVVDPWDFPEGFKEFQPECFRT